MTHDDTSPAQEFTQAFAQAAGAPQTGEPAPGPETEAEVVAESVSETPGHEAPFAEAAEDAITDQTPDFQTLFERERQRLRSFEGRVRRERDAWRRQEADYRRRLESASRDVPPGDGESAPTTDGTAPTPSMLELARREAMDAVAPYLEELKTERHQAAVAAAHPDWRELAEDPELEAFIDRQPGFVAEAMRRVVQDGEAEEVVALLDEFKRARVSETPTPSGRAAVVTPRGAAHDDSLEPALAVPSRASQPPIGRQKAVDYASAWSEAARGVAKEGSRTRR